MTPTTDAEGLIDHPPKRLAPRAQPTFNFRNPKRDTSISQSQSIRAPPSRRFLHNKRRPLSGPTPRLGMPRFKKSLEHVPILQSQQSRRHRVLPLQIRTSSSRAMNMAKNLVVVVAFADVALLTLLSFCYASLLSIFGSRDLGMRFGVGDGKPPVSYDNNNIDLDVYGCHQPSSRDLDPAEHVNISTAVASLPIKPNSPMPQPEPFQEPDDSSREVQFPKPDLSSSVEQTGNQAVPSSSGSGPSEIHQDHQGITPRVMAKPEHDVTNYYEGKPWNPESSEKTKGEVEGCHCVIC
ncbi:hypothetical protein M407DRAFT_12137 [Tulasnella calospora MUT 4182]|uniref:Uncharacterized protein n=1 Tax=Tulasnella calospora MUT 4182 TaxID=1051891 RepID=A0A0C3PT15_9AGAM|nr:hypothetical protein M407DRAFT_12137 [Tulasnella calospora MUT 4182]